MKLKDESLLSAYLDGELEPDERLSIESALLADPALSEQLHRLAAVRELVAALPRPVLSIDLAGTIGARIDQVPPRSRLWRRLEPRRRMISAMALGGLGLAASVLLALSFALHSPHAPGAPRRLADPGEIAAVAAPRPSVQRIAEPTAVVVPDRSVALGVTPAREPAGRLAKREEPDAAERAREAEKIREMLDSPHLSRTFIVIDVIGSETLNLVEKLVQDSPRTEASYGRITITQGIVIDPRHPNQATVFALVMNEQELKHFQKKLEQSFPQHLEDRGADPAVVTQLADIGQIAVLPGTRASEVVIPGDVSPRIALRTDMSRQVPALETTHVSATFGMPDLPGTAELGKPGTAEGKARENGGGPENTSHTRMALARKDEPSASASGTRAGGHGTPGDSEGSLPEGKPPDPARPEAGSLMRAPGLHEPPAIVLVWVTSP